MAIIEEVKVEDNRLKICIKNCENVIDAITLLRVYNFDRHIPIKRARLECVRETGEFFIPIDTFFNKETYPEAQWIIEEKIHIDPFRPIKIDINHGLFDLEALLANNKFTIRLVKKDIKVSVKSIVQTEHEFILDIQYSDIAVKKTELLMKRRVSPSIWQYHDKEVFLENIEENKYLLNKQIIMNLNIKDVKESVWDFRFCITTQDNVSCEYMISTYEFRNYISMVNIGILEIYQNGGKTLSASIKRCVIGGGKYSLEAFSEKDEEIVIQFQASKNEIPQRFYLVKKDSYIEEEDLIESVSFNVSCCGEHHYQVLLPKGKILTDRAKKARETWECFVDQIVEDNRIAVNSEIESSYYKMNSRITGKFFVDKKKHLAIYTHYGVFEKYEKTKVAVFGSCFSRSMFRSDPFFCEDYKIFYDCVFTQFHSSTISLMSDACEIMDVESFNKIDPKGLRYVRDDFSKLWLERLIDSKPEYIIIDLYFDTCQPSIKIMDNQYVSLNMYLRYSAFIETLKYESILRQDSWDIYFELWKKSMDNFLQTIMDIVPEENIIIFRGRFVRKYQKSNGEILEFGNQAKVAKDNILWGKMEEYIFAKYKKIRAIDMRGTSVIGLENHPLGFSTSHYASEYYRDALNCLNKIVLEDKVSTKKDKIYM